MTGSWRRRLMLAAAVGGVALPAAVPPAASAFNPVEPLCSAIGFVSGALGKVCSVAQHAGRLLSGARKLLTGHVGGAARTLAGDAAGTTSKATMGLALAAIVTWVVGGSKFVLLQTAHILGSTTAPQLGSVWFSSTYWRVAGIAALLTLPFLFAAAIQAILGSDLALLIRSTFGYLPLAALAVGIAAPMTMLLLSAADELSSIVGSAAGHSSGGFLVRAAAGAGGLTAISRSPFLVFVAGLLTVGTAVVLWIELMVRASAVYVIVLLLPLAFAAMVWPARRVWAVRAVELLVALVLSKFVIVAVLSLGGAALSQSTLNSVTGLIAGAALLVLSICAPWAVLRLLPMAEVASGVGLALRGDARTAVDHISAVHQTSARASEQDWASSASVYMRRDRDAAAETALGQPASEASTLAPQTGPSRPGPPDETRAPETGPAGHGSVAAPVAPDAATADPGPGSAADPTPAAMLRPPWEAEDWTQDVVVEPYKPPPAANGGPPHPLPAAPEPPPEQPPMDGGDG